MVTKSPVPRKLNQSMIEALCEYIQKGNYPMIACQLVGINYSTFYLWMKQAEKDLESGLTGEDSLYSNLFNAIKKAEADAEALMVETARNAAVEKKDGYLAITFNERRHPDRWGRRDRRDINIESKTLNVTRIEIVAPEEQKDLVEGAFKELTEGDPD